MARSRPQTSTGVGQDGRELTNGTSTPTSINSGKDVVAFRRPLMLRSKTDVGPHIPKDIEATDEDSRSSVDGDFRIRHGFEDQLVSEEYNNILTSVSHGMRVLYSKKSD